ncbi:MAG: PAS domain S-box protein, partial [Chloroflexota bacterium]|nr:PAS domain S-box protein [Chloroflexota bacterium]
MNDEHLKGTLQDLYEQIPCGYIFTLPDGTIVRANQTFLGLTGYERHELVSETRFQDLLTTPSRVFYENQYAPLLRMQGFVKEVALDLRCSDRSVLPVLVNSVQRLDEHGQPVLVASAIFDATHRRQYERELLLERRKAEELAAIVAFSSDAILSVSPDGVIQSLNSGGERLFGRPATAVLGRNLRELLTPTGGDAEWERLMQELHAGRAVLADMVGTDADDHRVEVSAALTPLTGLIGDVSTISAVIRDISRQREAERLQQEFLAMASHELRHPVAAIKGYAQLMQRRGSYSERGVETIVAQAARLERLIDDLMVASQIEAERLDLRLV